MFTSAIDDTTAPGSWSPSPLRRLLRQRAVYWSIALVLAVTAGLAVHREGAEARRVIERLGATTEVLVSDTDLAPGDPIAPLTTTVSFPVGLVPTNAVRVATDDATAGRRIAAGAVVTTLDLADPNGPGDAEAALAVASIASTPPLAPGDHAVLVVAADPFLGIEARMVDARVVSTSEERVIVAVATADLADVAAALQVGGVTVAAGP